MSEFMGWDAAELDNGVVRAVVVPDIGGRVLQFWLGEHPYLFVNPHLAGKLFSPEENWGDGTMASWKNYGGNKTWPAPQGWSGPHEWAGPPDPVLDSGRFMIIQQKPLSVAVQSPPDPRSGLQITRELTLEPAAAKARLRRTMRNISDRPVRWSLWDVTQLECKDNPNCHMSVPLDPANGFHVMYGPPDNPQLDAHDPRLLQIRYQGKLGKIGAASQAGWMAFSDGEWAFVHQFEVQPGAEYPDSGSSVEVWTHGPGVAQGVNFDVEQLRGQFMEMEVLAPLVTLQPGEESTADITWAACRAQGPLTSASPEMCATQPLEVERSASGAHVRGMFGVFAEGKLQVCDRDRVLLERAVSPSAPVTFDDDLPAAQGEVEVVFSR
jgi:hypothetical protein